MAATVAFSVAAGEPGPAYARHRPEDTALYQVLAEHWRSYRAEVECANPNGSGLPPFVVDEVEAFLKCGILAHGFLRVVCDGCGGGRLVPFSCKRRGFCASCLGRRMADFAAHLCDYVMPRVPVRQWVLTVPFGLRFRLAFDPAAAGVTLRAFVSVISAWLRRRARSRRIRGSLKTGGVTVIQRFGSTLTGGAVMFHPLPAPTDADVAAIAERIFRKISMKVDAFSDENSEALAADEPLLATLSGASVAHVGATGIRRGARPARIGSGISPNRAERTGRLCVVVEGFSLHAAVRIAANDRGGLEHLARYLAPPPIATDRLSQLADGRVMLRFKRPFSDGTAAVLFTPFELIERLLPLVPRPRKHTIRFHGILAPAAGFRSKVVPAPPATQVPREPSVREPSPYRLPWAELLKRVFVVDALECRRCHGRMRIVSAVIEPGATRRILRHLGEIAEAPAIAGPRAPKGAPAMEAEPCPLDLRDPDPGEGTSC